MNKDLWVKPSEEAKADQGKVVLRWKHVPGYGSDYIVFDTGDIVSAKRHLLMKQTVDKKGYAYVSLCKGGKYRRFAVHRLVAQAFCEKTSPDQICVNHKDENKLNNRADNLEWCTYQYNNNYGTARTRAAKTRAKAVKSISADGAQRIYESCTVASRETGIAQGNIWGACNNLWKHAGGMTWTYV